MHFNLTLDIVNADVKYYCVYKIWSDLVDLFLDIEWKRNHEVDQGP